MSLYLWRARLDLDDAALHTCAAVLSADERARREALALPRLRRRFTAARAFLRCVLGAHLGLPPAELRFSYGRYGKPALPGGPPFNLTHAEDLALLAVGTRAEVGLDLELLRPLPDLTGLAALCFCPAEQAALARTPPAEQTALFYRIWTRKEAALKALGTGLSLEPTAVEVSTGPVARLRSIAGVEVDEQGWLLLDLDVGPGHAAALALCPSSDPRVDPGPIRDWIPSEINVF
ncbi:MAG: 4'-phosphopantetheinyl transferase superfamily protein [Myxococcales bacterium]|nr:4'-phosphopantetheinyl transferase superfamily protein [Myxococcota bacterium]MDW8280342.1 4'-phosphopantetheinyl transferase superfamily protein [Myxococcales bacterium]